MTLFTTFVVLFCKDGGGSVNVNLWFLVVCVWCVFGVMFGVMFIIALL